MFIHFATVHELDFNGRVLYYARCFDCSEYGDYKWTEFWINKPKTKMQKRWWLFGQLDEVVATKCDFDVNFDIHDKMFTKSQVRRAIAKGLELSNREEEIKNGIII